MIRSSMLLAGLATLSIGSVYSVAASRRAAAHENARAAELSATVQMLRIKMKESEARQRLMTAQLEKPPLLPAQDLVSGSVQGDAAASKAALERGTKLVERAAAANSWGDAQATELRSLMPELSDTARDSLLRTLVRAINDGRLNVVTRGLPF